jgi:ubiquinone/menaquinone biosynthesis C-methylase UbiE
MMRSVARQSSRPRDGATGRRRGRYGVDAPGVLAAMVVTAVVGLAGAVVGFAVGWWPLGLGLALVGGYFALTATTFTHTTRRGKFVVWAEELARLGLTGDERVLDLGCGRGAILTAVARRLPAGTAVGVDLWSTRDQFGNAAEIARGNAAAEGVADRLRIVTGDMRRLPFADDSFDVVVSGLAVHNIPDPDGRERAVREALRVLRPGGRLLLADILRTGEYLAVLRRLGAVDPRVRSLGWRYWYGSPRLATRLVTAGKADRRGAAPG